MTVVTWQLPSCLQTVTVVTGASVVRTPEVGTPVVGADAQVGQTVMVEVLVMQDPFCLHSVTVVV